MELQDAYDMTAPLDAPGRRSLKAQEHLRTTAAKFEHEKLAAMLRICADGIEVGNPDAVQMCQRNSDRLWMALDRLEDLTNAPTATEIHIAALAFDRAARILKGEYND